MLGVERRRERALSESDVLFPFGYDTALGYAT
jgi:hypothetical protein